MTDYDITSPKQNKLTARKKTIKKSESMKIYSSEKAKQTREQQ